jgi:hypothetical protein
MRIWIPMVLMALLAACAPTKETARYEIGVSGDRQAAATSPADEQAQRVFLDQKARQICTSGYRVVKVDAVAAEDGQQIVHLRLICDSYRPDVIPLAALAPGS